MILTIKKLKFITNPQLAKHWLIYITYLMKFIQYMYIIDTIYSTYLENKQNKV